MHISTLCTLDQYVNDFVVHYDKTFHPRREPKEKEDFQTMNTRATLSETHPIEKVARSRHTRSVFNKFQVEFIASNNCIAPKI